MTHHPGKFRVGRAGDTRPAMGHDPLTYQGPRPLQYPQGTSSGRTGAVASRSSCSPALPSGLPVCAPTWAACHHGPGRPGHRTIGRRGNGAAIAAAWHRLQMGPSPAPGPRDSRTLVASTLGPPTPQGLLLHSCSRVPAAATATGRLWASNPKDRRLLSAPDGGMQVAVGLQRRDAPGLICLPDRQKGS